jgi:hypothetical protein
MKRLCLNVVGAVCLSGRRVLARDQRARSYIQPWPPMWAAVTSYQRERRYANPIAVLHFKAPEATT